MKKFTEQEIRIMLNQIYRGELSFSRMVEVINRRISEEEVREFKDGDFLHSDWDNEDVTIIFKNQESYRIYYHASKSNYHGLDINDEAFWNCNIDFHHATEAEKQELLDALAKEGKRWNAEKKCIEDIPVPKFQSGEKVRIKEGISNKTHYNVGPGFVEDMDDLIGKTMIVDIYADLSGYVKCEGIEWVFPEEWLEPYVEKFKKGDKVRIKRGVSSKTVHGHCPVFQPSMDDFIGKTMTVNRYDDRYGYVICNESDWRFLEDWLEPYVEDISKRKFKVGDKVRIKDGISSETHKLIPPGFTTLMDDLIGKELTVDRYVNGRVYIEESYYFDENWLEPYEKLKKGDLAIFWDETKGYAIKRGRYDNSIYLREKWDR